MARQLAKHASKWRNIRAAILREEPICRVCHTNLATQVDHIVPHAEGGSEWDRANLQPICDGCHQAKTRQEAQRGRDRRKPQRTRREQEG